MRLLRAVAAASTFLFLYCDASSAATETPKPEELKQWNKLMLRKPAAKKGCFTAAYPKTDWEEVTCVPGPLHPQPPRHGPRPDVVGNNNDNSAEAPSGFISTAIGSFDSVIGVTNESGPIGNSGPAIANAYTLQINTNFFGSTVCAGSPNPGCLGWQQFVYENDGGSGFLYIQYWLIRYNAACPVGQAWTQISFVGSTDIYCYKNNIGGTAPVPNQPIGNLDNLSMSGTVGAGGDSSTLSTGNHVYHRTGDNAVNAAAGWTIAEFNIFGAGGNSSGGGMASFNSTASIVARTEIFYGGTAPPVCVAQGFTGETNNLSFGPAAPVATAPGPAILFTESIAGGAPSSCAAASSIGDTHLATFSGLFYDFQASGDFTLAQVEPGFVVQTRQVSGAPVWPNATVNHGVATRMGKTQIAICLGARVYVDGKPVTVEDGKPLSLPGGVDVLRRGNLYSMTSESGDSVRAEVNSSWINVSVGLGRWPSKVRGLIANPGGKVNQLEARDGFVLNGPFSFEDLYHRYADSWRVAPGESMLSVCGETGRGVPKRAFFAGDLEQKVQEHGRGVCAAAGVKPGALFEACVLDVAVIGQDAAAKAFASALPPIAVGAITGAPGAGIPAAAWWVLLAIAILIIGWLLLRKKI